MSHRLHILALASLVTACTTPPSNPGAPISRAQFMDTARPLETIVGTEHQGTTTSEPIVAADADSAVAPARESSPAAAPEPGSPPTSAFLAPRPTPPTHTHPAALALLNEATRREKSGDLELAAAKLERALKIDPRSAFLWHRLANVRLQQGQVDLAASLAAKSNSYAASDPALVDLNEKIIARSKRR